MRGADLFLLEMRVLTSEHGFRIAADPLVRVLPLPARYRRPTSRATASATGCTLS